MVPIGIFLFNTWYEGIDRKYKTLFPTLAGLDKRLKWVFEIEMSFGFVFLVLF